jgi:hypothetical protein
MTTLAPGHHRFGGVSFTLHHPLIGSLTPSVSGSAVGRSVLAVISAPISPDTVFVDADKQSLFSVREPIARDRDVTFYRVSEQHPLAVLTRLTLESVFDPEYGYNCSFDRTTYSGGKCDGFVSWNWDGSTDRPKPIPLSTNVSALVGARIDATGSIKAEFHGLSDLGISFGLSVRGIAGVGIKSDGPLNAKVEFEPGEPTYFPIYGAHLSLLGLDIELSFRGCVGVSIRSIDISLPAPVEYYRSVSATVSYTASLSTGDGYKDSPIGYDVQSNLASKFDPAALFDALDGIELGITPELDVGVEVQLQVGSVINYRLGTGVLLDSRWAFGANSEKCPCPYLYGDTSWNLYGYVRGDELRVFRYKLLNDFNKKWPLFTDWRTPTQCIFSPQKSAEGKASLRYTGDSARKVLTNLEFHIGGFNLGALVISFVPKIQAVSGVVLRDIQLDSIYWGFSFSSQRKRVPGTMVFVQPPEEGQFVIVKKIIFVPQTTTVGINLNDGGHSADLGSGAGSVDYQVQTAQYVEAFKEFAGRGSRFVSFEPDILVGEKVGAITHSVSGEKYAAPLLEEVFDDASWVSNPGDFLARNELHISISSFKLLSATADVVLDFMVDDHVLKGAWISGAVRGTAYTGPDMEMHSAAVLDISRSPSLIVRVGLKGGSLDSQTGITIGGNEWPPGANFTLTRSTADYEVTLLCVRKQPTVIFKFASSLGADSRAIICRALEGSTAGTIPVSMRVGERYGILRFKGNAVPAGARVAALIHMPGMLPLCDNHPLETDTFVFALTLHETLFGNDIHIPFRRPTDAALEQTATIREIFLTTDTLQCEDSASIQAPSGAAVGCIEPIANGATYTSSWAAVTKVAGSGAQLLGWGEALEERIVRGLTETWQLHIYAVVRDALVKIVPRVLAFPDASVSFFISADSVAPYVDNPYLSLAINCSRAVTLRVSDSHGNSVMLTRGEDGLFSFRPQVATGYIAVAVCNVTSPAFCEFVQPLAEGAVVLLTYGSNAGLFEVNFTDIAGEVLPGVSSQLVFNRSTATAFKSWEGGISTVTIPPTEGVLTKIIDLTVAGFVSLRTRFAGVRIPFSAERYYNEPLPFFASLGVEIPDEQPAPEVVSFRPDGTVTVGAQYFNRSAFESADIPVADVLDLPPDWVTEQDCEVIEPHSELSAGAITGIVSGSLIFIAAVVIIGVVLWRRHKKAKFSHSPDELEDA